MRKISDEHESNKADYLIDVFHKDAEGFMACSTYEISSECDRIVVDALISDGERVWGLVEQEDGQGAQIASKLVLTQEDVLRAANVGA